MSRELIVLGIVNLILFTILGIKAFHIKGENPAVLIGIWMGLAFIALTLTSVIGIIFSDETIIATKLYVAYNAITIVLSTIGLLVKSKQQS